MHEKEGSVAYTFVQVAPISHCSYVQHFACHPLLSLYCLLSTVHYLNKGKDVRPKNF